MPPVTTQQQATGVTEVAAFAAMKQVVDAASITEAEHQALLMQQGRAVQEILHSQANPNLGIKGLDPSMQAVLCEVMMPIPEPVEESFQVFPDNDGLSLTDDML